MKAAFKKAKRRFKEQMMEKAGVSEKVSDPVFDEAYDRFQRWNELLTHVEDAHRALLSSMQQQSRASTRLADALVEFHFEGVRMRSESGTGFASDVDERALKEPIERFARVQGYISRALDVPVARFYRSEVIAHLRREQLVIPEIRDAVRHRQHVCLDYAAYKRKVQNSQSSSTVELQKRIDRERKLKDTRRRLDEETKNLLKTFTALERRRPGLVYEDICNVLAMQVHYHRRAAEMLERQLPHYHEAAFPLVQLAVLTSQARRGKVSDFLLGVGGGAEGLASATVSGNVQLNGGEPPAGQDQTGDSVQPPQVPTRRLTAERTMLSEPGQSLSEPNGQRDVSAGELSPEAVAAALRGRLNRRSSIQGFATTLSDSDKGVDGGRKNSSNLSLHGGALGLDNYAGRGNISRLRTGMQFSKIHSMTRDSAGASECASTRVHSAKSRQVRASLQLAKKTGTNATVPPPETPRGMPLSGSAPPPALPPRKLQLDCTGVATPATASSLLVSSVPATPSLPPPASAAKHFGSTNIQSVTVPENGIGHNPRRQSHVPAARTVSQNSPVKYSAVPATCNDNNQGLKNSVGQGAPLAIVSARHTFVGAADTELSFKKGNQIVVMKKTAEKGWWFGFVQGGSGGGGLVPVNIRYVLII